jgi:hypothetical protein
LLVTVTATGEVGTVVSSEGEMVTVRVTSDPTGLLQLPCREVTHRDLPAVPRYAADNNTFGCGKKQALLARILLAAVAKPGGHSGGGGHRLSFLDWINLVVPPFSCQDCSSIALAAVHYHWRLLDANGSGFIEMEELVQSELFVPRPSSAAGSGGTDANAKWRGLCLSTHSGGVLALDFDGSHYSPPDEAAFEI